MEGKCSVGIHDGTTCSNIKRKKTDTLQLESIHNLNDDISHLFSTINSTLLCCKTVTYTEVANHAANRSCISKEQHNM